MSAGPRACPVGASATPVCPGPALVSCLRAPQTASPVAYFLNFYTKPASLCILLWKSKNVDCKGMNHFKPPVYSFCVCG